MISTQTLLRALRKVHCLRYGEPIDDDLRGWNWSRPPLKPRAYLDLGVSEIAGGVCPTRRDLWLRRKEGAKAEPTEPMKIGIAVHNTIHRLATELSKLIAKGFSPWDAYAHIHQKVDRIVKEVANGISKIDWLKTFAKGVAFAIANMASELGSVPLTEFVVDGSLLGLSRNLRVDAMFQGAVVVEFKYGASRDSYPLALAGYALALESFLEIPIDVGLVITISNGNGSAEPRVRADPVYISNGLRQSFIEARDEAIDVLLSDSPPQKPLQCNSLCPFKKLCGVEI